MYMCLYLHVAKILTSPLLIQTFYSMCKGFLYSFLVREGIYYEKQIYEKNSNHRSFNFYFCHTCPNSTN